MCIDFNCDTLTRVPSNQLKMAFTRESTPGLAGWPLRICQIRFLERAVFNKSNAFASTAAAALRNDFNPGSTMDLDDVGMGWTEEANRLLHGLVDWQLWLMKNGNRVQARALAIIGRWQLSATDTIDWGTNRVEGFCFNTVGMKRVNEGYWFLIENCERLLNWTFFFHVTSFHKIYQFFLKVLLEH